MLDVLLLAGLTAAILFLIRNNWVYAVRINELNKGLWHYKQLETYNAMLFKFWIWNVEKFKTNHR